VENKLDTISKGLILQKKTGAPKARGRRGGMIFHEKLVDLKDVDVLSNYQKHQKPKPKLLFSKDTDSIFGYST